MHPARLPILGTHVYDHTPLGEKGLSMLNDYDYACPRFVLSEVPENPDP